MIYGENSESSLVQVSLLNKEYNYIIQSIPIYINSANIYEDS